MKPIMPTDLTASQQADLKALVASFPASFEQAKKDWAAFKLGVSAGLFSSSQRQIVVNWFKQFPDYWLTIRPNFLLVANTPTEAYNIVFNDSTAFTDKVDQWVNRLKADNNLSGLGILPLIVIAGIVIASLLGAAGAIWAISYFKQQANITKMIEGVTAGKLPASVLQTAVQEESGSFFGQLSSLAKWAIVGAVVFMGLPILRDIVGGRKKN